MTESPPRFLRNPARDLPERLVLYKFCSLKAQDSINPHRGIASQDGAAQIQWQVVYSKAKRRPLAANRNVQSTKLLAPSWPISKSVQIKIRGRSAHLSASDNPCLTFIA